MNSNENWHLEIDPDVWKFLRKVPGKDRLVIVAAIESFAA